MSKIEAFSYTSRVPANVEEVFTWHERPGAFERLAPPWVNIDVLDRTGGIRDGSRVVMRINYGPLNLLWTVEHKDFIRNQQFCDYQVQGPLPFYEQLHKFVAESDTTCLLDDYVRYQLPAGPAGEMAAGYAVHHEFQRLFRYRHQIVIDDLHFAHRYKEARPMKIAITGSTGFIGSALVPLLTTQGHSVVRMVRPNSHKTDPGVGETVLWNPTEGLLDPTALEGCDAIVHLAGDNIASERWNDEKKAKLRESRIKSTQLLVDTIGKMKNPPKVLVAASAIGFYGERHDDTLTEDSAKGTGFLADLCNDWEQTTRGAESFGTRVVNMRIGVVLSPKGGALQKMLLPFQMGAGGPIGTGKQWFSWIALDDVIGAILHALLTDSVRGPVNAVAPNPVTNAAYSTALGHALSRPAIIPMPAFAARMAFGEFADECLLCSAKVLPKRLESTGYKFRYPELDGALRHLLGKEMSTATR